MNRLLSLLFLCWSASAVDLMPPVTTIKTYQTAEVPKGATRQMQLIAVVAPPPSITLTWSNTQPGFVTAWEVHHALDIRSFSLLAVVGDTRYTKLANQPAEFFKVRSIYVLPDGTVLKSGWATK